MAGNGLSDYPDHQPVEILHGADRHVWGWHAWKTAQNPHNEPSLIRATGIVRGGQLIASVIYSAYRHSNIEIGIHSVDKAWCNRRVLRAIFEFPFVELELNRVTATTDPANPAVCNFLERIGFVEEGRLRQALPHGDLLILGMTRPECRWIN